MATTQPQCHTSFRGRKQNDRVQEAGQPSPQRGAARAKTIGRMHRYPWKAATAPALALDLSSTAVRLMGRTAAGAWVELGIAPLGGDFAERIDALRVEALVRGPGPVPVDLWLPPDQVLVRRYVLPAGSRGLAEALRRLSAETARAPRELSLAVAPTTPGEPATVLAVPAETAAAARDYAEQWGFRPGRVSTRVEAGRFGDAGPVFRCSRGLALSALGATAGTASAAVVAAMLALATWELYPADAPAPVAGTGPGLTLVRVDAGAPDLPRTSLTGVSLHRAQSLPARRQGAARDAAPTVATFTRTPKVGPVPALAPPPAGVTMRVGPAPVAPRHFRPGRLDRLAAASRRTDVTALVLGIDRIRATAYQHATPVAEARIQLASADATMPVIPAAAPARAPIVAALVTIADRPAPAEATIRLAAAGTMAPRSVPLLPPPRPDSETRTEIERATGEAPDTATGSGVTSSPGSELAAVTAPRPPGKPEQKARRFQRSAAHRAIAAGKPSPSTVRDAASQRGLELGSTNLIGVLDARSGRQALLRMAAGDYLKVGRGDTVDGWRVSTINRDSVRLTHGSQSRTLLLVVR